MHIQHCTCTCMQLTIIDIYSTVHVHVDHIVMTYILQSLKSHCVHFQIHQTQGAGASSLWLEAQKTACQMKNQQMPILIQRNYKVMYNIVQCTGSFLTKSGATSSTGTGPWMGQGRYSFLEAARTQKGLVKR